PHRQLRCLAIGGGHVLTSLPGGAAPPWTPRLKGLAQKVLPLRVGEGGGGWGTLDPGLRTRRGVVGRADLLTRPEAIRHDRVLNIGLGHRNRRQEDGWHLLG